MKSKIIFTVLAVAMTTQAQAEFLDTGVVTQVQPHFVMQNVPQKQCADVQTTAPAQKSLTGAIIGGVAGGLLGSQIGSGKGRIVTGAAGAGVGAIVGDRIDNNNNTSPSQVSTQCTMVNSYQQVQQGFDVTYTYAGHTAQTVLLNPVNVGDTVHLKVTTIPY